MVGYAHLDPVWLWPWTEGYAEARATLRSAVDRLGEFPEFVYTFTSVVFLEWVRESDPALFADITRLVATGRFHLAGGWWVEADCNLPSGESLIRQALMGQRFLAEHFGVVATVGGNPDSFGHAASLPQLLAGCGLSGYFFQRPERHEADLPGPVFAWRGADGTEVVACRLPRYNSEAHELHAHLRECLALVEPGPDGGAGAVLMFYGVGNHGGGPTRRNLASLRHLAATSPAVDVVCSTPRSFLDAVAGGDRALPSVTGELQHHARGCYAAHAGIKALNRRAEAALAGAELWSTVAHAATGLPYRQAELTRAWRSLLLNQFHDTLAGTAIERAYDDARHQLGETLAIAQRVTNAALGRLTQRIAIPAEDDMQPIVVFNPHPWPVRAVVEHEVGGWERRTNLVDDAGRPVPLQWGTPEAVVNQGRYRAVFTADVPPLGWRLYRLRLGTCAVAAPPEPPVPVLENSHLRVEIDPRRGGLLSLVDKATGVDLMGPGRERGEASPHAPVLVDDADTWGHDRDRWDEPAGAFVVDSVECLEHGPARRVVRVRSRFGASTLVEDYRLGHDDAWLDVAVTLDWRERRRMLKLRWPTALAGVRVTAEIPYGTAERRADGAEEPMLRFVDVSGTVEGRPAGLAVANDGKYAYDALGGDLGVTVARAVPYAHHDPAPLRPDGDHRFLDLGEQRFTLRLVPHAGDWRAAGAARRAAELDAPLICVRDTYHDGPEPGSGSFGAVGAQAPGAVDAFVVKRAETGDAVIVRLADTGGHGPPVTVRLGFAGDRRFTAALRPHEIATFRVPDDPTAPVVPVDLCEWADGERPPGQPSPDGRLLLPPLSANGSHHPEDMSIADHHRSAPHNGGADHRAAPPASPSGPSPAVLIGADHVAALAGALTGLAADAGRIDALGRRLAGILAAGGQCLVAGNGGSAAQAQHLTAELVGRYRTERRALAAIALHADTSTFTALVNDYPPVDVFARQVTAFGRPGDVLLCLSSSGRSPNLVAAAETGRALGLKVWALTGPAPNPLAAVADEVIAVETSYPATVQEIHQVVVHLLAAAVDDVLTA
jgi:alpha-mannosidase